MDQDNSNIWCWNGYTVLSARTKKHPKGAKALKKRSVARLVTLGWDQYSLAPDLSPTLGVLLLTLFAKLRKRISTFCGFATCSANTSASIASLQIHGLRHRSKQGNEGLHCGSHQGIRTKNQGGDGQLEACDRVVY